MLVYATVIVFSNCLHWAHRERRVVSRVWGKIIGGPSILIVKIPLLQVKKFVAHWITHQRHKLKFLSFYHRRYCLLLFQSGRLLIGRWSQIGCRSERVSKVLCILLLLRCEHLTDSRYWGLFESLLEDKSLGRPNKLLLLALVIRNKHLMTSIGQRRYRDGLDRNRGIFLNDHLAFSWAVCGASTP